MKREYHIVVDAKLAHHPTQDEIFEVVRELVNKRSREFPKLNGRTHVSITSSRFPKR